MPEPHYLLVTGDRNWSDYTMILRVIRGVKIDCAKKGKLLHVVCGAQRLEDRRNDIWRGADWLAIEACMELQIPFHGVPAPWEDFFARLGRPAGNRAGTDRNQWMLDWFSINECAAFHDNLDKSKGTKDMVHRARARRVPVKVHKHAAR